MKLLWTPLRVVVDRARGVVFQVQKSHRLTSDFDALPRRSPPQGAKVTGLLVTFPPLRQPDNNTCGSCTLVALKMLRHPWYAEVILSSPDPVQAFHQAALGVLRKTNALLDSRGKPQLPWPARGGTRPAAMVRMLHSHEGYGDPTKRYRNVVISPKDPTAVFDQIVANLANGEPTPLYVGDHRWMQHIVLVIEADAQRLTAFNPAHGGLDYITRDDFARDSIKVGPWTRPWLAILPR